VTGTRTNRGTVQRGRNYYDDCFPHQPILLISGNLKRCFPFVLFRPEKRVGHNQAGCTSLVEGSKPYSTSKGFAEETLYAKCGGMSPSLSSNKKQSHELSSNRCLPQLDEDVHYQTKHEDLEITSVGIYEYL